MSVVSRETSRYSYLYLPAIVSITVLGLVIRLYGLTSYGIWFDEGYHIQLVQLPGVGAMLDAVLSNPPSDPLYVLLLRPWVGLFGHSDGTVRLLSVMFSTATLPATCWLGSVLRGRAAGLYGALLLAVSPYALELGQEAALYALAALMATLAIASAWRWRATGQGAILFVALGTLAVYSHYVVAVILALFGLLSLHPAFGPSKVSRRAWILAHLAIFALWLPWLAALGVHWLASPVPRATLLHTASPDEVVGALVQFTSGSSSLLQGRRLLEGLGLLAGGVLLLAGWLQSRPPERRGLRLVVVVSALVFFVPAIVSALSGRWLFVPHFMLFLLPALFVVLGSGIRGRWSVGWKQARLATGHWSLVTGYWSLLPLALWLVAQVWGLALYEQYPPHGADGLRQLATLLRQQEQPGDAVLVTPPVLEATLSQYYPGPLHGLPSDLDLREIYLPYDPDRWYADCLSGVEASMPGHDRLWLIYRPELDKGGSFLGTLERRYKLVEHRQFDYAGLYLFTR